MATPFIGQISMFGGNFAPRFWAFCSGQLLSISQNTALFSILGTTYGGNGQTTFGLPDLRGRVPINAGTGPGLSNYSLGQASGSENVTLLSSQMPPHTHSATVVTNASSAAATDTLPNGNFLAEGNQYSATSNAQMNSNAVQVTIGVAGSGQPFSIIQPYLAISFIVALQGIFPSRN